MLNDGIQLENSENCILAVWVSNQRHKGQVTAKLTNAPTKAKIRANGALRSEPVANTKTPEIIGNQITKLNMGYPANITSLFVDIHIETTAQRAH